MKSHGTLLRVCFFCGWLFSFTSQTQAQTALYKTFESIADNLKGKLGVSVWHLEKGESVSYQGDQKFPMQSTYKFPIAMVMLHQIDQGHFTLSDTITIDTSEYIPAAGHSPLRDQYPKGVRLTLQSIIEYNVSKSDGTACDVLLRLLGGTAAVEKQLRQLGIQDMDIATTEMVQVAHDTIQYQNGSTPEAMNMLLRLFHEGNYLSKSSQDLLQQYMSVSNPWFDRRIKSLLPTGTEVIHKTGSSRTYDGLTRATNDIGVITLPNGSHLAISVFVSDAYEPQEKRERAIAEVAKAAYDYWVRRE